MPVSTLMNLSLSPSLIAASPLDLGAAAALAATAGATSLHIDIMDGHFVPNLTYGPDVVAALRQTSDLFFDVHLLVSDPARWVVPFAQAGADAITVHAESTPDWPDILQAIKAQGCQAGLALNPHTDLSFVPDTLWPQIDRLLVMSVEPGFSGQSFLDVWDKLQAASLLKLRYPHLFVTVDGGVNAGNVARLAATGIDCAIIGNAFYRQPDPLAAWNDLQAWLASPVTETAS